MSNFENLSFIDNPAIARRAAHYTTVTVDMEKVLKSWRTSLFSYEWIAPDGRVKGREDLPPAEQDKRDRIDEILARRQPLERPVLGIGLLENIEIGVGRAVFLTLAAYGLREISVHIPKSHESEFTEYLVPEATVS